MANVLLTAVSFLLLIFLWSFLKCTSREDHQAPSLMVTTHPPSAYLPPTHGSVPVKGTPCALAVPCRPWHLTFALGRTKKSFFNGIWCWAPWISQARSKGLSESRPACPLIHTTTILRRKKALAKPAW